jgi:hypothetical protein
VARIAYRTQLLNTATEVKQISPLPEQQQQQCRHMTPASAAAARANIYFFRFLRFISDMRSTAAAASEGFSIYNYGQICGVEI